MIKIYNGEIKTNLILFFATIAIGCSSNEEEPTLSCGIYEGEVYLKSQSEVEEFGKCNYSEITGGLGIEDRDSNSLIRDLSSLNSLTLIRGGINISNTRELKTLEGLNNAFSNETLNLSGNIKLENIDGLDKMQPNNLQISKNKALQNLDALVYDSNSVITIAINECPLLKNLNCFSNINLITHSLVITNNQGLEVLDGLQNVESVGIKLKTNDPLAVYISDNINLKNIDGLIGLRAVYRGMHIARNKSLEDIDGLSNVVTYNGDLFINDNTSLLTIDGLFQITQYKNLNINNSKIENLNGLSFVNKITGDLIIANNRSLTNFCGLKNLFENNGLEGLYNFALNAYNPYDILSDCNN